MTAEERKSVLLKLEPGPERKLISYKDKREPYDVYEIPLDVLIYNPYNGRIKAIAESWERRNDKLNPEVEKDILIIEQFLWDSAEAANKQTKASIKEYGQFETGIVTQDGVIIDGNRRACILNILNREDGLDRKFKAIILRDDLRENRKEIVALETVYQMGVDSKVDYNPIEKYLRCEELRTLGFSDEEISKMLSQSPSEVGKWFDILELMKGYLERYGYENLFIGLEKREGHFVDLRQYLRSYRQGVGRDYAKWDYTESDLANLTLTYNDYTRIRMPVQNCRVIANPKKAESFFCHESIWKDFYNNHIAIRESVEEEELDIISDRLKNRKIDEIIYYRDDLWRREIRDELNDNLYTQKRILEDRLKYSRPLKALKAAKSSLDSIEIGDITASPDPEITTLSNQMIARLNDIKLANS
ncbi:MAG: hypothetical protein ACFHWX_09240 [Bacteroidota bacterium]